MGLQRFFLNKKINQWIESLKKHHPTDEINKIQNVAILVDETSYFKDSNFKSLQKQMGLDDSHFNILTVKQKKSNYNEFKGTVLFTNEVNWRGGFKSPEIDHFTEAKYDLLIDFIPKKSTLKKLLVSKIDAKIKAGYVENNPVFYNLLIKVEPTDVELFIKEIVKYLHILKII